MTRTQASVCYSALEKGETDSAADAASLNTLNAEHFRVPRKLEMEREKYIFITRD